MKEQLSSVQKIDKAAQNLKKVYRSSRNPNWKPGKKYNNLPNWDLLRSERLLDETNPKKPKKRNHKIYKRGALVYVDFGVNIGGEFSGPHFAIVLNKKDNQRNEKLTVIPLTSKDGYHRIKLNDTVSSASNDLLSGIFSNFIFILFVLFIIRHSILDKLSTESPFNFEVSKRKALDEYTTLMNANPEFNYGPTITSFLEQTSNRIDNYPHAVNVFKTWYLAPLTGTKPENIPDDDLLPYVLGDKEKEFLDDFEDYVAVFDQYAKYNKESFARIEDITTLSKKRIRTINRHDPIGKIHVSIDTLDMLDTEITKLFLK